MIWLSINSYHFLIKLAGLSVLISITLLFMYTIMAIVSLATLIIYIVEHKEWRNGKNYAIIGFFVVFCIFMCISPMQITENTFQSPVKARYCYEGTMNTSRLYLRENGKFEDYNIGFFAYVHYSKGKWKQSGDTLMLYFKERKGPDFEQKLINIEGLLYKIEADTLSATHYYYGECKGLN